MSEDWPARVKRLEDEVAGLRRAMHTRGLIEQAKGMLAERLSCDPESAFTILSTRSQETNTPLVRIAADLVAAIPPELPVTKPAATAIGLADPRRAPQLRTITGPHPRRKPPALSMNANRTLRLAIAAMDAAADIRELMRAMATAGLKEHPGAATALFVAEPDGALRMLACYGWPTQAISEWRRVPSSINTAVAHAVRTGAPFVLDGPSPHEFVLIGPGEVRVVFPLAIDDRVVGALQFGWPVARRVDESTKLYLAHVAAAAGRVIAGLWPSAIADEPAANTADLDWVRAVLDAVHGHAHLLGPVRDRDGIVVDFRIEAVTEAADEAGVGRRLLDAHPNLADNGVFAAYVDVLAKGDTWQRPPTVEETIVNGRKRRMLVSRRASRVGGAVLASWERIDETISKDEHLARLEVFGGFGWAEWDLSTGEGRWSTGMYRLLGRDSSREPPPFESLVDAVDAADRERVERFVADVVAGHDSVVDVRVKSDDLRWLRFLCEAQPANVPDKIIYLLAQDTTERYAREQHLRSLQSRAAAGRLLLASQQDMTARLVDLLYPKEKIPLSVPGAAVRGRHFLPEGEQALRADFCDAVELPDGRVMMLIGDMFGAGMTAAATAVRLVRPALALGIAGTPLVRLLTVLNDDLRRERDPCLASLMVTTFDARSGELRLASAGHLPPLLLGRRAKPPRLLANDGGPALGLIEEAAYHEVSAQLEPGDALVCYTDGVVDRHRADPLVSLAKAFNIGYQKGGAEALLALPIPRGTDEACLAILAVLD